MEHQLFRGPTARPLLVGQEPVPPVLFIGIKDLQGHVLFIGFGSSFFVSVKDFPMFPPNYVFLAHDNCKCDLVEKPVINEVVVYNIENDILIDATTLGSWMNYPPIRIRPSFSQHK